MKIGIVGLGYVGLPLAVAFAEAGHDVVGVDSDSRVADALRAGRSHIEDVPDAVLQGVSERFQTTTRYADLAKVDAIVVAVPTPLTQNREPDLQPLIATGTSLAGVLQGDQLVVLESTTYPGTTRERFAPLLEESGLAAGRDFNLAFSPERIDPGPHGLHPAQHPQDRRRPDRRLPAARGRDVRARLRRGGAGLHLRGRRAEQAARERLPLGQHRTRQRARDPLRPDGHRRLGGRGCRGDQALRLHVLQAGPGDGRALPAGRPLLPGLAGARVRHADGVHRAGRRGQPAHARISASSASRGRSTTTPSRSGGRGWRSWASSYKPGVGDLRESPALKIIRLLREQGADVVYQDDYVEALPDFDLRSEWPAEADCVVIVTAHPEARRGAHRAGVSARRRLPRRDSRYHRVASRPAVSEA